MSTSTPHSDTDWSPRRKVIASLLIVGYLAVVIVPPLAGPPPASDLARMAFGPLRPFIHALGLDHGYRFFAPNPGPGHSIRWVVTRADGSTVSGSTPDRDADWPRLLYHRRFMVAEKVADRIPPADVPEEIRREARADWEPLVRGVARHLLDVTGGTSVRLEIVEHFLPGPDDVVRGEIRPDTVTPLGTFTRASGAADHGAVATDTSVSEATPPGARP
ncbi:MAG: hypothetical protein ACKOSQ_10805 [Planctomycetaceae bacterium]